MSSADSIELVVSEEDSGSRLDAYLAAKCPERSRMQLRRAISAGGVLVDGRRAKPAHRLHPGQRIVLVLPDLPRAAAQAEPIALDVLYEDDALAVVNKPPRMVVHPSKGHGGGTLANALAHHFQQLSAVGGSCSTGDCPSPGSRYVGRDCRGQDGCRPYIPGRSMGSAGDRKAVRRDRGRGTRS